MLTGCGHASAADSAAASAACHTQYEAWRHGPAAAPLKALGADTAGLTSAGRTEDVAAVLKWLKAAGIAASGVAATPLPRCADPAGYYRHYLSILISAGRDTAKGLNGLLDDETRLLSLSGIDGELQAELDRTVGKNR